MRNFRRTKGRAGLALSCQTLASRAFPFLALAWSIALAASAGQVAAEERAGWAAAAPADGRFVRTDRGFMVPYKITIPGTKVEMEMVPVPGGKIRVGSPDAEPGRKAHEGPVFEVVTPPFWMGKHEVTWAEYRAYMSLYAAFKEFKSRGVRLVTADKLADAITAPTELYDPSFTFELGDDPRLPATTMTQYAAKQYTKWLSGVTGDFYRLPTEAEWEYACRAGAATAYAFGDDPATLEEHAWFADNSDEKTHFVGLKKPNAWGLYDMHGNVAEWTLDELRADGHAAFGGMSLSAAEAVAWPKKLYPRVIKGGFWDSKAAQCRAAARMGSHDEDWKDEDPNLPLSPWWFTSYPSQGVGFRLLRPLAAPATAADKAKYWEPDVAEVREDVDNRVQEGRGALGLADPELPAALKELKKD